MLFRLRDEAADGGMDDGGIQRNGLQLFKSAAELGLLFAEACLEAMLLVELLLLFDGFLNGQQKCI